MARGLPAGPCRPAHTCRPLWGPARPDPGVGGRAGPHPTATLAALLPAGLLSSSPSLKSRLDATSSLTVPAGGTRPREAKGCPAQICHLSGPETL